MGTERFLQRKAKEEQNQTFGDAKLTPGILLDAIIHGYANSVDEEKQQRIVDLVREEMAGRRK